MTRKHEAKPLATEAREEMISYVRGMHALNRGYDLDYYSKDEFIIKLKDYLNECCDALEIRRET